MASEIKNEYQPEKVSHPGETLHDLLEERGMPQTELAKRAGRPVKTINEIIKGKAAITPDTAIQFEYVLGLPSSFWNIRQKQYEESVARHAEVTRLESHVGWLKMFPIKQMTSAGYIPGSEDKVLLLEQVLNFFGVANPEAFEQQCLSTAINYRKSASFEADDYALAAWLRQGRLQAENLHCRPYNRNTFRTALLEARTLTRLEPREFVPKLQHICAAAGVAVVFVPELPKIRAYGASYWLPGKAVIQLCLRGKKDDTLWFTFFHEAGHIVLHERKRAIFLDVTESEGEEEDEASRFASELLIPHRKLKAFVNSVGKLSHESIISFADKMGISPSIVVGQLHHFGYAPFSHFQKLRITLEWNCSN